MGTSSFAPIFPGWNVWQVWQVKDLPFSVMMFGLSRDKQLQIWVDDELRNHSGADVTDPINLKGSQIEIIDGAQGLNPAMRKEDVPDGATFIVSGDADLRTVRFFNKGPQTTISWPHDDSYLLDAVMQPVESNPATSGPAPTTIGQDVAHGVTQPISDAIGEVPWYMWAGATIIGGAILLTSLPAQTVRKVKSLGTRKRK